MSRLIIVEENTDNPLVMALGKIIDQLIDTLKPLPPEHRAKIIASVITSCVVPMPDDQWRQTMHSAKIPCGNPSCRCHIVVGMLMDAIDECRDDAMAHYKEVHK